MDAKGFDCLAKTVGGEANRRRVLAGLLGSVLAGLLGQPVAADNACKPLGKKCNKNAQCCSEGCAQQRCCLHPTGTGEGACCADADDCTAKCCSGRRAAGCLGCGGGLCCATGNPGDPCSGDVDCKSDARCVRGTCCIRSGFDCQADTNCCSGTCNDFPPFACA